MKKLVIFCFICVLVSLNGQSIKAMRQLWSERVVGENLASGKKVSFSATPSYHLTHDAKDVYDLTDGKISANPGDLIWVDKDTVGWFGGDGADNGINLLLDLGEVQPVDKIVIRCLGGANQNTLRFPRRFDLMISRDGKNYYRAATMEKLMPAEMSRSNFINNYFLEENGKAYVYPFEFKVNAEARYIGLTLTSSTGGLFVDEMAAIKGNSNNADFNKTYQNPQEDFHMSGVIIRPRLDSFDVPIGIDIPHFMVIRDMRTQGQRKEKLQFHIEAPVGLTLTSPVPEKIEEFTVDGQQRVRISLPVTERPYSNQQINPLFFRAEKPFPEGSRVVLYTTSGDLTPVKVDLPLKNIIIPQQTAFKDFHVSLAWMAESDCAQWPDFYTSWAKLGFNAVSSFPRYWNGSAAKMEVLNEAEKKGFKRVMNESPLHVMMENKNKEIYCQVENLKGLCPSYRGDLYLKELDRVEHMAEISRPDYVFMDIEAWYNSDVTAKSCPRCLAAQKQSGLGMKEYTQTAVTKIIGDLHNAIIKGVEKANKTKPIIGAYGMHPSEKDFSQMVMNFDLFYPQYVDIAQPSLYLGNYVAKIRETIRKDYKLLKERKSIPWLTAGTYGEFAPHFLEYIVLEAFMNGASGITYYIYSDFDTPQDFYYHAKALSLLTPYENLLSSGKMAEVQSSNPDIVLSAWQSGDEMLILAGNYALASENITITLPSDKISSVQDIRDNKKVEVDGNQISLQVPKGDIRLLYIKL